MASLIRHDFRFSSVSTLTPPPNVGLRTTPHDNDSATGKAVSGATTVAGLDAYTEAALYSLPSGEAVRPRMAAG